MPLSTYIEKFQDLNVNRSGGHSSPHKVCMLLAVMDLIGSGALRNNRIEFNETLLEKYRNHFEVMKTGTDQLNPHLPYYHLKSEEFWHHAVRPGREAAYEDLTRVGGAAPIRDLVNHAYLDDELFEYMKYSVTREQLKYALFENI